MIARFLTACILSIAIVTSHPAVAQNSAKTPATNNLSVQGSVFVITRSGDIKKARFAEIFICNDAAREMINLKALDLKIKMLGSLKSESEQEEIKIVFLRWQILKLGEAKAKNDFNLFGPLESVNDQRSSLLFKKAKISKAGESDVDGNFKVVCPKGFLIIASGRAGANESIWISDPIDSSTSTLNLKEPEYSWFDIN